MDKIYSRKKIRLPNFNIKNNKKYIKRKNINRLRIIVVTIIAFSFATFIIRTIEPVLDKESIGMARSMASKISNEQSSIVMEKYKYEDLCYVQTDDSGNIKMIKTNVIPINDIISNISFNIQKELEESSENDEAYIRLGTLTGSKFLSGRGPKIGFKISNIGNVDTELKSNFTSAGINQTLHRIFLNVKCRVIILTPFNSIEEEIVSEILLAESVIIGTVPDTYYNLEGLTESDALNVLE